jgi:hypothetical protein
MEHGMVSIRSYGVQCKPYCGYYSPTADIQGAILSTVVLVRTYRVLLSTALRLWDPTMTTTAYWTHPFDYSASRNLAGITIVILCFLMHTFCSYKYWELFPLCETQFGYPQIIGLLASSQILSSTPTQGGGGTGIFHMTSVFFFHGSPDPPCHIWYVFITCTCYFPNY